MSDIDAPGAQPADASPELAATPSSAPRATRVCSRCMAPLPRVGQVRLSGAGPVCAGCADRPPSRGSQHPLRSRPRSVTVSLKSAVELEPLDAEDLAALAARPRTRGDCVGGPRPCPWMGCKHHLALEVNAENGSIRLVHPDRELDELADTCALDVADRGEHILEEIGQSINLTRERVRHIVDEGDEKLLRAFKRARMEP